MAAYKILKLDSTELAMIEVVLEHLIESKMLTEARISDGQKLLLKINKTKWEF